MIDVSKIFKPKNMRRGLLLALLFAPLVYLFGTQFTALSGAHGEEVLKVDATREEIDLSVVYEDSTYNRLFYSEDDIYFSFNTAMNGTYIMLGQQNNGLLISGTNSNNFSAKGFSFDGFTNYYASYVDNEFNLVRDEVNLNDYVCWSFVLYDCVSLNERSRINYYFEFFYDLDGLFALFYTYSSSNQQWVFSGVAGSYINLSGDFVMLDFGVYDDESLNSIRKIPAYQPTIQVPIEGEYSNYSDSLFGNFFNSSNWVSNIGKDAFDEKPIGFEPINVMARFVDENLLHLKDSEYGDFLWGYAIYACNVFLVYELIAISMMVIGIPFIVVDWFSRKSGGDC